MSDIFVSYSRQDRAIAAALAEILPGQGWTLYWDRQLRAGEVFDDVLEREVTGARCVVALWSSNSVGSQWVRNEADVGARSNALISVLIENVTVPLAFRRVQAADLIGWKGDPKDPRLTELLQAIAYFLGGASQKATGEAVRSVDPPAARFEPAALQEVEHDLAWYVGPIAASLVKSSAGTCADLPSLYRDLAQHVPLFGREEFLSRCRSTVSQPRAGAGLPPQAEVAGLHPPPAWVAQLKHDLVEYLGPVTELVVTRALRESPSLEQVLQRVSAEIPNEQDRLLFLRQRYRLK
ncbi:MAG: toll/interleukin-1 receptor domain-containing protein [Bryobacteraceae bacterium]